jgi:hypothetical protein
MASNRILIAFLALMTSPLLIVIAFFACTTRRV